MKINEILIEGPLWDLAKGASKVLATSDIKGLPDNATFSQKIQQIRKNKVFDTMGKTAASAWQGVLQKAMTANNNQELDNNAYRNLLLKFINNTLTGFDDMSHLNSDIKKEIDVAVKNLVNNKADTNATPEQFKNIITAVTAGKQINEPSASGVSSGPAEDIRSVIDADSQYKFPHPDYRDEGINIIVRKDGWFLDKLPAAMRGQVLRDKTTRLYPVLKSSNISKFNTFYNQAADLGRVKEEPKYLL